MSGVRARRVKRNKALMTMYCPSGIEHGPQPTINYWFKSYYSKVMVALAEKTMLECTQMFHGTRTVTFPVEVA